MTKPTRKGMTRRLDVAFSLSVRSRGVCEMCSSTAFLQCAHVVTRANRRLRWTEANACCLCAKCHFDAHAHPLAFAQWFATTRPDDHAYVMEHAREIARWTLDDMQARLAELQVQILEAAA